MIKTRFAPSPTGYLHVGGLRTALFAYLFAKKNNGIFTLRVEDTDRNRYVEDGVKNILTSLYWAGIVPDEGVTFENNEIIQKGDRGPYIQSERLEIYHKYAQELLDKNHAYYCFCDKERLEKLRESQELNRQPTGYDGLCSGLSKEEVEKKIKNNTPRVIRMRMPKSGKTEFNDLIRGKVEFENSLLDDQVLIKADGFPTYHFAVVVDDHLMEITHIIRGEEWISSTPKHVVLYEMFGWTPPEFAHLALLINEQRQKLSKRQGDVSVESYKNKGYLPEALINFTAFLGWNPGDDREIFSLDDLKKEFDLSRVSKSAAVFNLEKLDWYNKKYLSSISKERLLDEVKPFLMKSGFLSEKKLLSDEWLEKAIALEKERVSSIGELVFALGFVFKQEDYAPELLVWRKSSKEETKTNLEKLLVFLNTIIVQDWTKEKLEKLTVEWIKENGLGVGNVLWPFRVSLSGKENSPGPFEIAEVLGKDETVARVQKALKKL